MIPFQARALVSSSSVLPTSFYATTSFCARLAHCRPRVPAAPRPPEQGLSPPSVPAINRPSRGRQPGHGPDRGTPSIDRPPCRRPYHPAPLPHTSSHLCTFAYPPPSCRRLWPHSDGQPPLSRRCHADVLSLPTSPDLRARPPQTLPSVPRVYPSVHDTLHPRLGLHLCPHVSRGHGRARRRFRGHPGSPCVDICISHFPLVGFHSHHQNRKQTICMNSLLVD